MADNLDQTGQDRQTVSDQKHELSYLAGVFANEFPNLLPAEIGEAIRQAKDEVGTDRQAITEAVRKRLSKK